MCQNIVFFNRVIIYVNMYIDFKKLKITYDNPIKPMQIYGGKWKIWFLKIIELLMLGYFGLSSYTSQHLFSLTLERFFLKLES